ncbi:MAG: ATP-binding protein [Candidatus Methanoplasma sp.]|jgi:hypothetical protein|nr:ATP-binding protein [Candidatus Methanoplasma sp.]
MLVDFTVENFGPFRDEVTLSLQSTSGKELPENIIHDDAVDDGILGSAVIFGANASGKSYLFLALETLRGTVFQPFPANTGVLTYQPFRLDPHKKGAPTRMEIRFIVDGILYHYLIRYDRKEILEEWLNFYPKGQKAKVFHRKKNVYEFGSNKIATGQGTISKMTGANSAYLAVAAQMNNEICVNAHRGIINNIIVVRGDDLNMIDNTIAFMNSDPSIKEKILDALAASDFGITEIEGSLNRKKLTEMTGILPPQIIGMMMITGPQEVSERILNLRHGVSTAGLSDADKTFPYQIESKGTLKMLGLMGPVIEGLKSGRTVIIDEFGAYMHHDLCKWIVTLFKQPGNTNNAQLLINTHNQLLMDLSIFRRDQMFFTEKDRESGASDLYSLHDFNIRKEFNVQKNYEIGRFGAVPRMKELR